MLTEKLTDIGNFLKRAETCWSKEVQIVVKGTENIVGYFGSSLFTTTNVYTYEWASLWNYNTSFTPLIFISG